MRVVFAWSGVAACAAAAVFLLGWICRNLVADMAAQRERDAAWDKAHLKALPELSKQIGDTMTGPERAEFLTGLECYDRPAITLTRHRYVLGKIAAKCDYDSAIDAFRHYGGRVDRSTVVAYEDGDEHLGTWEQVWPLAGDIQADELPRWERDLLDRQAAEEAAATPASAGEPKATNEGIDHE